MSGLRFAVDDTIGAASIGFSLSCAMFGGFTTQCVTYFQRYPGDRHAYKMLVALIWFLELIDQIFIGHAIYFYTITNFASPLVILTGNVVWTFILQLVMGCLVGTIVKCCFAMRVWTFSSRNYYVTGLILLLTFGQFGLALAYCVRAFEVQKLVFAKKLTKIATLSLGFGVVTDGLIAFALCFFLRRLRTGYKHSDSLVNTLTVFAVNTGLLTSLISLITLILYNLYPTKLYFVGSYFILSKLYAISFMATLNTRKAIRGRGTDRANGTTNTAQVYGHTFNMISHNGHNHAHSISQSGQIKSMEIGIHQEISVTSDVGNINQTEHYPTPPRNTYYPDRNVKATAEHHQYSGGRFHRVSPSPL